MQLLKKKNSRRLLAPECDNFKNIFYSFERVKEREGEKRIMHLLVYSPMATVAWAISG